MHLQLKKTVLNKRYWMPRSAKQIDMDMARESQLLKDAEQALLTLTEESTQLDQDDQDDSED